MYSLPIDDLKNISARLEDIWPKEKVFLLTGGTGFFGRWLVEAICYLERKTESRNRYIIISRQSKQTLTAKIKTLSESFFEVRQQDIQDRFKINETLDYVIHAASDVTKIKNSKESDFNAIVIATKNLLEAIDHKTIKFLYISSGGVYNSSENGSKEDDIVIEKTKKVDSYSEAKRQSELLVKELANSCIARCFTFVGPFVDPKMAVMDMINKKVQKQGIVVNSPTVVRSFMYPSDLVVSLFKLLILKNNSHTYNVGSDQEISLSELAKKISFLEGHSEVIFNNNSDRFSLAGKCYFANIDRINAEYGNIITVDLESALYKTYDFMNKEGQS